MAKDRLSGKLLVILHADVIDSTQMVQQDEHLAHQRIQDTFHNFSDTIKEYSGHVLELRGDALLAEFERPSDAVAATIAFQASHSAFLALLDDDLKPGIRVGIAMGEVVVADNTVTGAGVVMAQRVEQFADSGGLCISSALQESLSGRLPIDLESLGEQNLKGFGEPIKVYKVKLRPGETIPPPQSIIQPTQQQNLWKQFAFMTVAVLLIVVGFVYLINEGKQPEEWGMSEQAITGLPDKPSIAVLPFANVSSDPNQEYFADGITDDLINDLSKISGLVVIGRNSVFSYKNKPVNVRQVAEELSVRYVLEGSIRRSAEQVRINAQLIDTSTGGALWAERYDDSVDDVFALQDKVALRIVSSLRIKITPEEQGITAGRDTSNVLAYDAYLQGSTHLLRKTPEDAVIAISFFEQALELDPNYASSHRSLAQIYWDYSNNEKFNTLVDPPLGATYPTSGFETHLKALKHLQSLKKIRGETSSQTLALSARMLQRQRRFDEAVAVARQAVILGPNNPAAYDVLIENLIYSGEPEEALLLIENSLLLDPNSPGEKLFLKGMAFYTLERFEEAVSLIDKARSYNRGQTRYAAIQAAALTELNRMQEARVALNYYLSGWTTYVKPDLNLAMYYWPFKHRETLEKLAQNFTNAGLKIPLRNYYLASEEDRLVGDDIKSLLSGKIMIGGDRGYFTYCGAYECGNELELTRDQNLQILDQGNFDYFQLGEKSRVENDLMCDPWYELGDYCVAIFRNPDGNRDAENEFLFFTLMSNFSFSVF